MEDKKNVKNLLPKDLLKEVDNGGSNDLSASFSDANKEIFDAPSSEEKRLSIENLETARFIFKIIKSI
jgi:hypothetical protein